MPQKHREGARGEEARREKATHLPDEGLSEKYARTDKSDTEIDTCSEGGGEADTFQSHSRHKKGHMTNIYLSNTISNNVLTWFQIKSLYRILGTRKYLTKLGIYMKASVKGVKLKRKI